MKYSVTLNFIYATMPLLSMNINTPDSCSRSINSIIYWLADLLTERFGFSVKLVYSTNNIRLYILDRNKFITLPLIGEKYLSQSTVQISCGSWDPCLEGWNSILNKPIPTPNESKPITPLIISESGTYTINYDIFGLLYWVLSRKEEVNHKNHDNHDRFPASSSHAFKHGYLERPIVDEWIDILGQVIERQWPNVKRKKPTFSIKVSHDVDSPSRYGFANAKGIARLIAIDLLINKQPTTTWKAPWLRINTNTHLHQADPHNTFNWIMDQSEQNDLTSAFYFICGRTDKTKDSDYEIEHPAIRNLIKQISARGHEIGLHPSYNTFQNPKAILAEANRLKRVCEEAGVQQDHWGGRMHFLRWEHPTTLYGWELAKMDYDSTLSYSDRPGFRCGTCFEYKAFDPVTCAPLKLKIRPLIAMECTIIANRYMGLGYSEDAKNKFLNLKETCQKVGGVFTLLWHNSHFNKTEDKKLYQEIIK